MIKHFYTIRQFMPDDAEATTDVHHQVYNEVSGPYRPHDIQYFTRDRFAERWASYRNRLDNLQDITFVAQNDATGQIVGLHRFGLGKHAEDRGIPTLDLHQFYVRKEVTGLGSAFLYLSLGLAEQYGFKQARIERNESNIVSKAFQIKRLLAVDVPELRYEDLDIPKGKFGAPHDITSYNTVSYIYDIRKSKEHLGQCLDRISLPYRVNKSISGLFQNEIKTQFYKGNGRS